MQQRYRVVISMQGIEMHLKLLPNEIYMYNIIEDHKSQ